MVILFTDIVGFVSLERSLGTEVCTRRLAQHDAHFREVYGAESLEAAEVLEALAGVTRAVGHRIARWADAEPVALALNERLTERGADAPVEPTETARVLTRVYQEPEREDEAARWRQRAQAAAAEDDAQR